MLRLMRAALTVAAMVSHGSTLAAAKSYRWNCTYPREASPDGLKSVADFKMEFGFDDVTGKAVMFGNNGISDLEVHIGSAAISFAEKLATGAVQNTIITFSGNSVHSRHSVLGGKMIPSQYYGQCVTPQGAG